MKYKYIPPLLVILLFLTSCNREDPFNKIGWLIYGFPIMGVGFLLYTWLFGSKDKNDMSNKK